MDAMNDPKLIEALTRIEMKLDHITGTYSKHLEDHADHENRLRSLEKRLWAIPSMAVVISVATAVLQYLH